MSVYNAIMQCIGGVVRRERQAAAGIPAARTGYGAGVSKIRQYTVHNGKSRQPSIPERWRLLFGCS